MAEIEYRPMGGEFILPICPQILLEAPLDPGDPNLFKLVEKFEADCPDEDYEFFRTCVENDKTCAILAWDRYLVVGAVTFFPQKELRPLVGKVYGTEDYPEAWWKSLPADSSTLAVGCVTVAKGYRGMGVATGLVKFLIKWARVNSWRRLIATGVKSEVVGYDHRLALPFWENLAFRIIRVNNLSRLKPAWSAKMKTEILKKHEMGEYMLEGIDFSLILKNMGWDGILASYDLELKFE